MKKLLLIALGVALAWSPSGAAGGGTKRKNRLADEAAQDGAGAAIVKATGTLQPEEVTDIGAQVGGKVIKFGPDPAQKTGMIDHSSVVKAGTVLAQLDAAPFEALVVRAKADLQRAEATLRLAEARVVLAERELQRTRKRMADKAADAADVAVAEAALDVARAGAHVEATGVAQGRAALKEAELNLDYTTIRAPFDGVVIDRRVNVGQTVTAAATAPSLFLLAKDLKRMEVWVSIKEADIGRVAKGQAATFSIAAFPKLMFKGRVSQIRLNAAMTDNEVTYTVVIETDNSDGRLLPFLTADVSIAVAATKATGQMSARGGKRSAWRAGRGGPRTS